MTIASGKKEQYDEMAIEYNAYEDLPVARLEAELIKTALGDCTGLTVLDIGGGSGVYAREAVKAGAAQVDVVDISDSMMQIGREIEAKTSGKSRIRWLLGDGIQPLVEQDIDILPYGHYDITMANWIFDHACTVDDLRGMWENIAASLKPGGKFIGVRAVAPGCFADHNMKTGKYGTLRSDVKVIPGGFQCTATLLTKPPFSVGCTLMDDSYKMIDEIPRQLGMIDIAKMPDKESETIKSDPEFWQEHLNEPGIAVVIATKGYGDMVQGPA
ncbi:S-adenosyl-L-methionine-dependent methyltransferase [Paraphoma chrysanthemicola]|nr:S-adenosyl-L-methionine-dependent methyltransferase [Paraphoma chrysanthemicola]